MSLCRAARERTEKLIKVLIFSRFTFPFVQIREVIVILDFQSGTTPEYSSAQLIRRAKFWRSRFLRLQRSMCCWAVLCFFSENASVVSLNYE